jgi:hypothetical protein
MASAFSSKVTVDAEGLQRPVTISMNKPLRHRGYTFYQASYSEDADGAQTSTLAVARNYGRLIPYVATTVIVVGMLVHFAAMLFQRSRAREART